nr:NAD(P)(+) transhydrogenase (Re/Si-specific) subunit beta [Saprospiraceae bacterium]
MTTYLLTFCYIVASVTFIVGLKMLSSPASARKGNLVAAVGMTLAIFATIFLYENDGVKLNNYGWIFGGLIIGGIVGTLAAKKVKMTSMPEMVSLFNGMGGACAALISIVEFNHLSHEIATVGVEGIHLSKVLIIVLGLLIGSVSFAGSMVAWGKLNGSIKDFSFTGQNILNLIILAIAIILGIFLIMNPLNGYLLYIILALALIYGVMFVMPIGGA